MALPELKAVVTLDRAKFQRGLAQLRQGVRDFGVRFRTFAGDAAKTVGILGTAVSASAAMLVRSATKAGDAIHKMALRTGLSTETLSRLQHAAQLSDASLDDIGRTVKNIQQALHEAGNGSETAARKFTDLGLSIDDLKKMKPDELMMAVMEAVASIEDPTIRGGKAIALLGKSAQRMMPMLAGGRDALRSMIDEADKLGLIITQDQANAAAALSDEFRRLKSSISAAVFNAVPFERIQSAITALRDLVVAFRNSKHFEKMRASISDFVTIGTKKIWEMANAVFKLTQVWGLLDDETKAKFTSILKAAAIFAVAWKSGILALFTTTISAVLKMFSVAFVPGITAAFTAVLGAIAGFKIGEAIEKTFDFSGVLLMLFELGKSVVKTIQQIGKTAINMAGAIWAGVEDALRGRGFTTDAFNVIAQEGKDALNQIRKDWHRTVGEIDQMRTTNGKGFFENLKSELATLPAEFSSVIQRAIGDLSAFTDVGDIAQKFQAAFAAAKGLTPLDFQSLEGARKNVNDMGDEIDRMGDEIRSWTQPFRGLDRMAEKAANAVRGVANPAADMHAVFLRDRARVQRDKNDNQFVNSMGRIMAKIPAVDKGFRALGGIASPLVNQGLNSASKQVVDVKMDPDKTISQAIKLLMKPMEETAANTRGIGTWQ
jgi:hypothetical protein